MKKPVILYVVGAAFLLAVAASLMAALRSRLEGRGGEVLRRLPTHVEGWSVKDSPIATSVEMKKAVAELLNFDEAVFREYRRADKSLEVYVAYWRPGKLHPRLIMDHVPDVCWVSNGWTLKASQDSRSLYVANQNAWPAEFRSFELGNMRREVIYWHIVDGRPTDYKFAPGASDGSFVRTFLRDARQGYGEQFFIRLSSEKPWSEWENEPVFKMILEALGPVLVARRAGTGPGR